MFNATPSGNLTAAFIIDNSASAIATMAMATLTVFSVVISLALFIALPPGFCSRRARWLRLFSRTVEGAGKVLMEEIRGEEEVPVSSGDEQEDEEWVNVESKKEEEERGAQQQEPARPLSNKWTKLVLNHEYCSPTPRPREDAHVDPLLAARGTVNANVNANKSGDPSVYF